MLRNTVGYHENEYERIRGIYGLLGLFDLGTFDIMPYRADQYCSSEDSTTYHGPPFHFHIHKRYEHRFPNHLHTFDFLPCLPKSHKAPLTSVIVALSKRPLPSLRFHFSDLPSYATCFILSSSRTDTYSQPIYLPHPPQEICLFNALPSSPPHRLRQILPNSLRFLITDRLPSSFFLSLSSFHRYPHILFTLRGAPPSASCSC